MYEPEAVLAKEVDSETGQFIRWERESSFQALGAISGAITPTCSLVRKCGIWLLMKVVSSIN